MKKQVRYVPALIAAMSFAFLFSGEVYASDENANVYTFDGKEGSWSRGTGTTVITAYCPPEYGVDIPAQVAIPFGEKQTAIGDVVLSEANLEQEHQVRVTVSDNRTLLPKSGSGDGIVFVLKESGKDGLLEDIVFSDAAAPGASCPLSVEITQAQWDQAKSGQYAATLSFSIVYEKS